ncbi:MAG: hypothetical protein ABUK01_09855 [Leptospirales bacterium]
MNNRILIVDTTFLDAFYRLKILTLANQFYSKLLIPVSVEKLQAAGARFSKNVISMAMEKAQKDLQSGEIKFTD